MQYIFNILDITATACYFVPVLMFGHYVYRSIQGVSVQVQAVPAVIEPEASVALPEPESVAPVAPAVIEPVPVALPEPAIAIDFNTLTVPELRKQCQERNIDWRNEHGKGKHLKKTEMLTRLRVAA